MEQALQQHRTAAGNALTGARILIVEDQREVAELLEDAICDAGGQVLAISTTVEEAMARIATEDISAAVITMIAGGTYTDDIARELIRRDIPFVVTTGIGADHSHPELHAATTIIKPFQASYLQAVLGNLVTRRETEPTD